MASDACKIKVVMSKPMNMSKKDFDWLSSLPFGVIIFGFPQNGMKPLPTMIANGDLDGDRYFLLWEPSIVTHVNVSALSNEENKQHSTNENVIAKEATDWLSKAQQFMVDQSTTEVKALVMGQLYCASGKAADDDKETFLLNAVFYAKALYQALDNGKHGTKIALPNYLWHAINKKFHRHLDNAGVYIRIRKEFSGTFYNGQVLEYALQPNGNGEYVRVFYDDGDTL
jgi:RNA dependent RNA polymerase.